jgi:hypothetical protein
LYCIVLYCTALFYIVQSCAVPYDNLQSSYFIILYFFNSIVLCCAVLCYIGMAILLRSSNVLHCSKRLLHCILLRCTALCSIITGALYCAMYCTVRYYTARIIPCPTGPYYTVWSCHTQQCTTMYGCALLSCTLRGEL